MKVRIDKVAGAAYITLIKEIGKGGVAHSVTMYDGEVNLDFDHQGYLVGIEILNLYLLHADLAEGAEVASDAR